MEIDTVTGEVVSAAVHVHRRLGPGLLESVYQAVLEKELNRRRLVVQANKSLEFEVDGTRFREGLRVDMLVNGLVVVELKAVEKIAPVHLKQVLTYIRLLELPVGLLLNFGAATMKEGLYRIVNQYHSTTPSPLRINQIESAPDDLFPA
jgi:iron complex transport system substrate-binding protein